MLKGLAQGVNSVVAACVALTILSLGLIAVQADPLWLLGRNILLAALGESTPGIEIQGDNAAPTVECDRDTGVCTVSQ